MFDDTQFVKESTEPIPSSIPADQPYDICIPLIDEERYKINCTIFEYGNKYFQESVVGQRRTFERIQQTEITIR